MSKTKILNAAKKLLWSGGYEAMSPRKVMDESGAGQGSLYHHFRSKKDLAAAALEEVEAELLASFETSLASKKAPLDKIRAYLEVERDGLKGCRIGRLANEVSVVSDPDLQALTGSYFRTVEQRLTDLLQQAQEGGDLPASLDCEALAMTIAASVQGGFVLSRSRQDSAAVNRATSGMISLLDHISKG